MNPDAKTPDAAWLVEALADLPDPMPPERLYGRIMASHRRRRRQRQLLALAATLLAGSLLWPLLDAQRPQPGPPVVAEAPLPATPQTDSPLLHIDRRLQAAYDQGASPEQIATLWQVRERLAAEARQQEAGHARILSL